mmetsp:Transcript_35041/g.100919  ORF Transcript_35041/g.100919 Transcript_35041/m.100919 type:complete len:223 (-) Transcript_35041:472-1140(-)
MRNTKPFSKRSTSRRLPRYRTRTSGTCSRSQSSRCGDAGSTNPSFSHPNARATATRPSCNHEMSCRSNPRSMRRNSIASSSSPNSDPRSRDLRRNRSGAHRHGAPPGQARRTPPRPGNRRSTSCSNTPSCLETSSTSMWRRPPCNRSHGARDRGILGNHRTIWCNTKPSCQETNSSRTWSPRPRNCNGLPPQALSTRRRPWRALLSPHCRPRPPAPAAQPQT